MKAGAESVVVHTGFANGGDGATELADAVVTACEKPNEFDFLTPNGTPVVKQIEAIATKLYGAAGIDLQTQARKDLQKIEKFGLATAPVCMAKTQNSLSHDPALLNRPTGFILPVRGARPQRRRRFRRRAVRRNLADAWPRQDARLPQHRHRRAGEYGGFVLVITPNAQRLTLAQLPSFPPGLGSLGSSGASAVEAGTLGQLGVGVSFSVMLPTIEWKDGAVVMIDQRKLPASEVYVTCKTANEVAKAIKTMVIRGAPAIGVAAAMGLALGMRRSTATGTKQFTTEFQKLCDLMAATRPTAVNLFWAIERMKKAFAEAAQGGSSVDEIKQRLEAEAQKIHDEDVAELPGDGRARRDAGAGVGADPDALQRRRAGDGRIRHGAGRDPRRRRSGQAIAVLADETRPFLQGARLTAWELVKDGIDTTVITDNMAGAMMRLGNVDLVVVGADRIAANGDVANKIGTYAVAVLAKEHGIPFYVAAPISTVDLEHA